MQQEQQEQQLALGTCSPEEACRVLITVELCGLKDLISVVDSLPGNSIWTRGRSPALLVDDDETVVFGVNALCRYLHSKAKTDLVEKFLSTEVEAIMDDIAAGEKPSSVTTVSTKCPLSVYDMLVLSEKAFNLDLSGIPNEARPIFEKYAGWRDGRSAQKILSQAFRDAISRAFPDCYKDDATPVDVKFDGRKFQGTVIDYSFSGSQQLMNVFKSNPNFTGISSPQAMAERIVSYLNLEKLNWIIKKIDVAGFYVNISVSPLFLQRRIDLYSTTIPGKVRLPSSPMLKPNRIVVDFSSPNIAKEMHVGHLRSTIIGDSLCRFFEQAGHEVLRVNHVGDWGTQFGMLLEYLRCREKVTGEDTFNFLDTLTLTNLTNLYRDSKMAFDGNPTDIIKEPDADFKNRARQMVVSLQSGKDAHARQVWQKLVDVSKSGFESIYSILNVSFDSRADVPGTGYCGESFYQDMIEGTIKQLGKLVQKRGDALLMFTGLAEAKQEPTEEHPDGEIPLFLRKSDGGYGYDSTDMAAVRFRIQQLKADRVLYVTDAGQQTHFHMIFEAAKKAGWTDKTKLDHVKFGVVTAKGGGKFKTRTGETVTLNSLLESAKERMKAILQSRLEQGNNTTTAAGAASFDAQKVEQLSGAIGAAAVKYFDLRNNRTKDYEFDEELMCSPDGDTAVYLMYAYARVSSIIDKANEVRVVATHGYQTENCSDRERSVAFVLSRFNEVVDNCLATLSTHVLCGYLFSLASDLSTFLTDDAERIWAKRAADSREPLQLEPLRGLNRLLLMRAVRAVLYDGLGLLGIVPFERM